MSNTFVYRNDFFVVSMEDDYMINDDGVVDTSNEYTTHKLILAFKKISVEIFNERFYQLNYLY